MPSIISVSNASARAIWDRLVPAALRTASADRRTSCSVAGLNCGFCVLDIGRGILPNYWLKIYGGAPAVGQAVIAVRIIAMDIVRTYNNIRCGFHPYALRQLQRQL